MWYTTTYHAAPGPYYDDSIFTSCDDTYHYEETGFNAYFSPYGGLMFQFIDGNANDLYWMEVGAKFTYILGVSDNDFVGTSDVDVGLIWISVLDV